MVELVNERPAYKVSFYVRNKFRIDFINNGIFSDTKRMNMTGNYFSGMMGQKQIGVCQ